MIGECSECSSTKLSNDNFSTRSTPDSDLTSHSDVSDVDGDDENVDEDSISNYKWARCKDSNLQKILFKTSIDESIRLLNSTVKAIIGHLHVKRLQSSFYNMSKTTSLRFLFTWITVKVTKTSKNGKSSVPILLSVYSQRVAVSVILRIKLSVSP